MYDRIEVEQVSKSFPSERNIKLRKTDCDLYIQRRKALGTLYKRRARTNLCLCSCWRPCFSLRAHLLRALSAKIVQALVLQLDDGGQVDANRLRAVIATVLDVVDSLIGYSEGRIKGAFVVGSAVAESIGVALLIDGELHRVDNVRDDFDSVLEPHSEPVRVGGVGKPLDVVDVGLAVVTKAVLVPDLPKNQLCR